MLTYDKLSTEVVNHLIDGGSKKTVFEKQNAKAA